MGKGYLIDSNTIIDLFNGSLHKDGIAFMISIDPIISIVTYIEIFSSRNASIAETEQLRSFAGMAEIIQTDFNIAQRAIDIRLKYNTKFGDPVIAGTALDRNLIPIKRNTKDFANISGLKIINPYTI